MTPWGFPFQYGSKPAKYHIWGNWDFKFPETKYHQKDLWNCFSVGFAKEPPTSGTSGATLQFGDSASPDFRQTHLATGTHHLRWVVLVHVTPHRTAVALTTASCLCTNWEPKLNNCTRKLDPKSANTICRTMFQNLLDDKSFNHTNVNRLPFLSVSILSRVCGAHYGCSLGHIPNRACCPTGS